MADDDKDDDGPCAGSERDVMHLGPDIGNGCHPYVRHKPGCTMEAGLLKPRGSGGRDEALPPCDGIVRLKHTGPGHVYDVETLYERARPKTDDVAAVSRDGPAMVVNDAYRSGWDRIFGPRKVVGQA